MSIREKFYKGAIWNAFSQFGSQGINFIITIVLARLLTPKDFGLVGMVTVITSFLGYFTEFGLTPTLIQKKEIDELDCHTVYWSTVFFAVVIYIIVFFSAPLVGAFYNDNRLILITRVLFINFLCSPLAFIPEVLENKKLNYNKIAIAELGAVLVSGTAAIVLVYLNFGVWSLVVQQILFTFSRGLTLMLSTRWFPKFRFSFKKFKELCGFGFHFTAKNLISYLSDNIDSLLVGKLLGPAALGIYGFSQRVAKYPMMKFWQIFGRMFMPAFVSIRDETERVKKNMMRINLGGGFLLIPLLITIFFVIEPLILLLVGHKWIVAVPVIKILVIYMAFTSLCFADESLMIVLGELKMINAFKLMATIALLFCGYFVSKRYGIIGMAVVFTVASFCYDMAVKARVLKLIGLNFIFFLRNLKTLFLMTAVLALLLWAYSIFAPRLFKIPLLFLLGASLVLGIFLAVFALMNHLIDFKAKRINIDNLLLVNK